VDKWNFHKEMGARKGRGTVSYEKEMTRMKLRFGKNGVSLGKFLGLKQNIIPPGYTDIDQFLPEDVFIVGFPKSGNTWFQHLVSGVVHGVDARTSPPLLAYDLVPDVHQRAFYRRYSTPMFFKSHSLPRPDYHRVVYLLRDGRDTMVSCFHYLEALRRAKLDFLDLVTAGAPEIPCKWHQHVNAWHQNPHDARMLVIKYEDLVSEPVEQLERFCKFINLDRGRGHLKDVAEAAQFRNLRAKEARLGMGYPDIWPADKFFFRRGVVGSYRDEMPLAVLRAFLGDAAETLRDNGYLPAKSATHAAPVAGRFDPDASSVLAACRASSGAD
jgi:Sulfotransferase domain